MPTKVRLAGTRMCMCDDHRRHFEGLIKFLTGVDEGRFE